MVLFKRKPVQFLDPPDVDDDAEVWTINQTGEIFAAYEDYLRRLDFYNQRRFICQISGRSGLTFFQALQSELIATEEVDDTFPDALKGPILRRVQFSEISRLDNLVDSIYDEFRADYYPGETVTVSISTAGERMQGVVREKTRFGAKVLADGSAQPAFSRYIVQLETQEPGEDASDALIEDSNICRDRRVFTKNILRGFIKKTVTREAWNGAPWIVKKNLAEQYGISTRVPPHLQHENKLLERKMQLQQKKAAEQHQHDINSMTSSFHASEPARLPNLKPMPGKSKGAGAQTHSGDFPGHLVDVGPNGHPFPVSIRPAVPDPAPAPPPPKYPIEDLQVPPRDMMCRPLLKYWCMDPPVDLEDRTTPSDAILMKSVGPLLETWDTLNVYCEKFQLDSFTFDDFAEAMELHSEEQPVELYVEIHCAVLKLLVSDQGNLEVSLPEPDEEEEEEEEEESEPTPEPEPKPTTRATRRSLAKLEAERLAAEAAAAEKEKENPESGNKHRAAELLREFDWIEQLSKRNFKNGGWETIMVGFLFQLSHHPRMKDMCDELLAQLVPANVEPSQETVRENYLNLDVNYRIQALQLACMLTATTKTVRSYMEECSAEMTNYRKEKIEHQRTRKEALEDLKTLNDERRALNAENEPKPPEQQENGVKDDTKGGDTKMADADESTHFHTATGTDSDEDAHQGRSLRRGQDRANERKRKREEEQERKKEAESGSKSKHSKQMIKILKEIQKKEDLIKVCEKEIAVIDNDLREADCPRTRVLGKDRFWNRYYWFERNGMPYAGLPNSSTATAGYANGLLWVQGPDDIEREGFIDTDPEYTAEYKAKFGMTPTERKRKEEGATSVFNAWQWGYYSEPEDLERLIKWLDVRGVNELKLRKELVNYKDRIITHMKARKEYLNPGKDEKEDEEEEPKRMITRTKTQPTPEPPSYRCLSWTNLTAQDELGHLHSEPPPKKKQRRR